MRFRARVRGQGTVEVPGYGVADAEHRLEKEIAALDPTATVQIREIRRVDSEARIVETFALSFAIRMELDVEEEEEGEARRKAFAAARDILKGSRYERVAWDKADLTPRGPASSSDAPP